MNTISIPPQPLIPDPILLKESNKSHLLTNPEEMLLRLMLESQQIIHWVHKRLLLEERLMVKRQLKRPFNNVRQGSSITIKPISRLSKRKTKMVKPSRKFNRMKIAESLNGSNLLILFLIWKVSPKEDLPRNKEKDPPKMKLQRLIWVTVK